MLTAAIIAAGLASVGAGGLILSNAEDGVEVLLGAAFGFIGCFIMAAGFLATFTQGGF